MGAGGGTHGLRRGIHGGRTGDPWVLKVAAWGFVENSLPEPSGRQRCRSVSAILRSIRGIHHGAKGNSLDFSEQ